MSDPGDPLEAADKERLARIESDGCERLQPSKEDVKWLVDKVRELAVEVASQYWQNVDDNGWRL